jgi:hypothetical protein
LEGRSETQAEVVDAIISQRDAAVGKIESESMIIAASMEGAATKLEGIPGDAGAIAAALTQTVEIFKKMRSELSDLKTQGKTPPRLQGEKPEASWFKEMSRNFRDLWSSKKTNAAGFIPNFAADPAEQRALRTESAMGPHGL